MTSPGSVWVAYLDLEVDRGPVGLTGPIMPGQADARILVRLHGAPLGFVNVPVAPADTLMQRIESTAERTLSDAIRRHRDLDAGEAAKTGDGCWAAKVTCPRQFPTRGAGMTIVICTRDRAKGLAHCLDAVRNVYYQPLEILVVDNAPGTSETMDLVLGLARIDSRIRYTCEPQPGLSAARNHGLAQARYDLVAFTDDDALVDAGWPTALAAGFASDPAAVCMTGFVPTGALDTWSERYFDARYSWSEIGEPRRYDLIDHRVPVRFYPFSAGVFGTGANFAVRRRAVASVGGFDTLLGAGAPGRGGEDLDMFLRLVLAGGRICHLPSAYVWHLHRSDPDALGDQIYSYGHGLGAYLAKHRRNRQLQRAMARHGLAQAGVMISRMRRASRTSQFRRSSAGLGFTETRGLLAGALTYWRAARRPAQSADASTGATAAPAVTSRQHENSLPS